jgi:hypothetical protein
MTKGKKKDVALQRIGQLLLAGYILGTEDP